MEEACFDPNEEFSFFTKNLDINCGILPERVFTREQISTIFSSIQEKYLSRPSIGHPDFFSCPSWEELLEMTEDLFLETSNFVFDGILGELKRRFGNLALEWKRGTLQINGAKTNIKCKDISESYNVLRKITTSDKLNEIVINSIAEKIKEIFKE